MRDDANDDSERTDEFEYTNAPVTPLGEAEMLRGL
jgi:hypothetical protein